MTIMEPGETLTITASLSTTTFVALRARTNTEVTLRIAPPGGCSSPVIGAVKRNSPRAPSFKLSSPLSRQSSSQQLVHKDSTTPLPDKSVLQGWVMVSTQQPLSCWNIAWVTATTSPTTSKICVKLEGEADSKSPSTPLNFEEIDTIMELEADKAEEAGDPVKFEIKTKSNNTYKILTNSFMTVGMRDLKQSTMALAATTTSTPSRGSIRLSNEKSTPSKKTLTASKGSLTRVSTPKPSSHLPIPNFPATVNNTSKSSSKTSISRTSTPLPDIPKPAVRGTIPPNTARRLQARSSSTESIPTPAARKSTRPLSVSVYDYIPDIPDSPKPKDPRAKVRLPSKRNKALLKLKRSQVMVAASILTECAKLQECDAESDFSTWDSEDGASDFSEVGENLSEWENNVNCDTPRLDQLACLSDFSEKMDSDFEIRDLCEMSKGLSPEINITLGCLDDNSSCFSEDMSDIDCTIVPDSLDDISTDYLSDRSTILSSISSTNSSVFDGVHEKNHKGLRGLQKMITINKPASPNMNDKFKTGKWEQKQMKRMEKEAKRAARMAKILEKKEKKEKKREQESAAPKKPLSLRLVAWRRFFQKSDCIAAQ